MKKYFFYILWVLTSLQMTYAANDAWLLWDSLTTEQLRNWDIHTKDIPNVIKWAINFWMWIAWTIAVIFIILWAFKILFWSLEQDKTKWKDTIIMAIFWFAIASLAWFIIRLVIDNLG